MNTAQLSVLPDELAVVSLTPLRRAVQRVRALGARYTGLAMPWGAAGAPRQRHDRGSAVACWRRGGGTRRNRAAPT